MQERNYKTYLPDCLGPDPCHRVLADRINRLQPSIAKRLVLKFQEYSRGMVRIDAVADRKFKLALASLWQDHYLEKTFSPFVDDYFRCCVRAAYRKLLRGDPLNCRQWKHKQPLNCRLRKVCP